MLSFTWLAPCCLGGPYPSTTHLHALECVIESHTWLILDLLCLVSLPFGASDHLLKWPKNTNWARKEKIQFSSIQHHRILHLTHMNLLGQLAIWSLWLITVQMTQKQKGEKIQFTKHPTRCSMQSSIGLQESLNNRTHIDMVLNSWNLSFVWSWNWERGGGHKLHTKNSKCTMFGVRGWRDQCWAGIRKWVRASQGFRLVLSMKIGRYHPWWYPEWDPPTGSHWSENQPSWGHLNADNTWSG